MQTSHQSGGPGSLVRPGPTRQSNGDFRIIPANDNPALAGSEALASAVGLLLRLDVDALGAPVVTIRVMHDGGDESVLHRAYQGYDVIAIWRGLGRDLGLPLYLAGDGEAPCLAETPRIGEAFFRRGGSALSHRRPRFLARRKTPLRAFGAGKPSRSLEA